MKVLLEILSDASQLLKSLDDLGDLRVETRAELEVILQGLCAESARLLGDGREVRDGGEVSEKTAQEVSVELRGADEPGGERCAGWLMHRALEAMAKLDYEGALGFLKEGAAAFPDDVEFYNHLGLVYWELGDLEAAGQAYLEAMGVALAAADGELDFGGEVNWRDASQQDYLRAMEGRALCLCRLKAYDEALVLFDALGMMNPVDYAGCHYMAGEIRHQQGNFSRAICDYRKGPVEPATLYNLGLALFQDGQTQVAAATFIRAFVSNIHVFHVFCGRESLDESCVPGYLGGREYAVEFVRACRQLWDACPAAVDFMESCYDHPLVRAYLSDCREDGGESMLEDACVDEGQLSWLKVLVDERSVEGIAQNVIKRLYS